MARRRKLRYEVIIYWSDEDEAFIAEVAARRTARRTNRRSRTFKSSSRNGLKQRRNSGVRSRNLVGG
jgi:hypothetical protein